MPGWESVFASCSWPGAIILPGSDRIEPNGSEPETLSNSNLGWRFSDWNLSRRQFSAIFSRYQARVPEFYQSSLFSHRDTLAAQDLTIKTAAWVEEEDPRLKWFSAVILDNTLSVCSRGVDYVVVYLVSNAGRASSKWIHENDIRDLIKSTGTWIIGSMAETRISPQNNEYGTWKRFPIITTSRGFMAYWCINVQRNCPCISLQMRITWCIWELANASEYTWSVRYGQPAPLLMLLNRAF